VGSLGLLVGVFIIFLVGSGVRYGGANRAPKLATSCTTPGLALSVSDVVRGRAIYFAVTGPAERVVLAIDAATLSPDLTATPVTGADEAQVIRPPVAVRDCKGDGVFGVQVPPGTHTVGVFPAAGGAPLVTKPLTVTER
jgi:hypothetical protein